MAETARARKLDAKAIGRKRIMEKVFLTFVRNWQVSRATRP
jgi:hypothetical protein